MLINGGWNKKDLENERNWQSILVNNSTSALLSALDLVKK